MGTEDIDIERAKNDFNYFAENVLGIKTPPHMKEIVESDADSVKLTRI